MSTADMPQTPRRRSRRVEHRRAMIRLVAYLCVTFGLPPEWAAPVVGRSGPTVQKYSLRFRAAAARYNVNLRDRDERNRLLHHLYNQDCRSIVSEQDWNGILFIVLMELNYRLKEAFNKLSLATQICEADKNLYC